MFGNNTLTIKLKIDLMVPCFHSYTKEHDLYGNKKHSYYRPC